MKKKSIVLLLALCMVVSLLPVAGHATREQRWSQQTKVAIYMGDSISDDTLYRSTTYTYSDDGDLLEEQTLRRDGDTLVEQYYCRNYYDENGSNTKSEFRENGESWTETYTYEWPGNYSYRRTTVRTPGNITTVFDSEYVPEGGYFRERTTVDGRLASTTDRVYGDGVYYDVTTNYDEYGSTSLYVTVFDMDTGMWLNSYDCNDLSEISVTKKTDAQGNVTEIGTVCGDLSSTLSYADGLLIKRVSVFEQNGEKGTNFCYYNADGSERYEEIYINGVFNQKHTMEYDTQANTVIRTDTDPDGNVLYTWIFSEKEFVIPAEPTFDDVPVDAFYFDPVEWAVENGITSGVGNNRFAPNDTCTRSQAVTFLWRAMGRPEPKTTVNPFTDVSASDWYYKPVLWAAENNITSGIGGGKFDPNGTCNRAQIVSFLWRAEGRPEPETADNPFSDVSASDWYYKPVLWAAENGITSGYPDGRFGPNDSCTRGQIVTFLFRNMGE